MGFLSGLGRELGRIGQNVPMAQAALAGDYGSMASMRAQQERQRAAQAEAEMEAQLRAQAAQALAARGYAKSDIGGMRPEDVSQLLLQLNQPRQFASGGGSVLDPRTGQFTQAPSRHEYQGSVFDVGPTGQTQVHRQGMQAVPLQPGGEVAIVNSWTGREVGQGGAQATPQAGSPPRINSPQELARLPSGSLFVGPDGVTRRKP